MSNLPLPVHQQVQLQVNPRKKTWRGSTELKALVPPGQQTVGLHCFNLSIQQVTVNGIVAEFTVYQYPSETLSDLTVEQLRKGSGKESHISSASEHAYDQYVRLMHKEQEPELIITIPQQQDEAAASDKDGQATTAAAAQAAETPVKSGTPPAAAAATTPKQTPGAADANTPAATKSSTSAVLSPAAEAISSKQQQQQQQQQQGSPGQLQQTLIISITFLKPPDSIARDTSMLLEQHCLVANPQLRRARGWFPCIDSPLHIYTPGAPHCLPYTFNLQLTVPPSFMAVCSGSLVQQTCAVLPVSQNGPATEASSATSNGVDWASTVVVARTFEYSVATPVMPSQLSIAVGPFVAVQYSDLLAAAGIAAAALPAGSPVITVFAPVSDSAAAAALAQQQQGANVGSGGSKIARSNSAAVQCLGPGQLRQLADTVKPLSVLLRAYDKVLSCMFPWSRLQVAVVPDGCLLDSWQAGLGSILLRDSCRVTDNLVLEPRLASASCLAAALAQQYFGLLLLPKGPEDSWLLRGLAGWLEGQGLKQIVGSNELHYRRWQERVWLSAVDDGEQLGPLSPQVKEADKGFTAAWGRLHGTQDLEPSTAMAWKATAVIHMLERKIGEDELRKVVERYINGAKHAAANTAAAAHQPDAAPSPAPKPPPPAVPTTSGTTAGGTPAAQPVAAAAPAGVAAVAAAAGGLAERFMTTAKFMRTMGKKQGFKKEAPGFFSRWVHGTGIPRLTAGISWDSKRSLLLLALRQAGSKAVMQGALKASEPVVLGGENTGGAAPGGRACTLKVLVRELDSCEEHPLQVDASRPLSLHDIKVSSKLGPQRRRMQAAAAASARRGSSSWVGGAAEDLDVSEAELRGVPVLWVQVDHSMEWLAAVQLRQPAHWWALQLEHSKDVVAQAQAVAGLCDQLGCPSSSPQLDKYIISVLGALMRNPGVFCRVRLDAAMALGSAAGKYQNNYAAVELFNFVRERLYDPYTGLMQPNDFTDLGEALLNQGLPAALARITMLGGYTPEGILAQLLELLTCSDNSSNPVDDGHWLAALVRAMGQLRLSNAAELAKVLKELDRMLAHEAVVGTHNAVLGCACLTAVTQLATQMQHSGSAALLNEVRQLLTGYVAGNSSSGSGGHGRGHSASNRHLKATAYSCMLHVAAASAEAQLRDMMAGLEAAAAAAASVQGGSSIEGDGQPYQQQVQQVAYTASYSQLLQQLLLLTAAADVKPPLLLDGMLETMLQLLAAEQDPVHRIDICKAALLVIGRLEQQGFFELKPTAVLPDCVAAMSALPSAAVPAVVDVPAPTAAAGAVTTAVTAADGVSLPQQTQDNPQPAAAAAAGPGAAAGPDGAGQPHAAPVVSSRQQQPPSVVPVSVDMMLRVQELLNSHHEPAVRQLTFMLLQKLAGQPATLYREREDDDEELMTADAATTAITAAGNTAAVPAGTAERAAGAGGAGAAVSGGAAPSGSMRTGVTGGGRARSSMPAASAGGISVQHTGTTAPMKLRLGKLGIKKPPAAAGAGAASPAGAPASTAAAAASDAVQGSSPGTATAVSQPRLQVKAEPGAAAAAQPTPPSAAVTPFAASEQQQGKADRAPSLPPLPVPAAVTAGSQHSQQQQQVPAGVPSVAGSAAQIPSTTTAAVPAATPSTAAGIPVRSKPLTKMKTLPGGSTGSLTGQQPAAAASQPAAAAPVPAQQQQQPQHRQLAGTKRAASPHEHAPAVAGTAAGSAAAAAGGGGGVAPALKKPKLKKAGIPGQPAQQAPATAALPAATVAAAAPPPAAAVLAPAPSAAPSSSNVTASGVSGLKKKLKIKIPQIGKKKE